MMVIPMDARVVITKPTRQEMSSGGIILPDSVDEGKQTEQGIVEAVGPGSRNMNDGQHMPMDIEVGDKIIYTKFSAVEITHNGKEFFVVTETDIIAKIEE